MQNLKKNVIIDYLTEKKPEFLHKFGIKTIALFGSFASDKNSEKSDIDIAYETSTKDLTLSQLLTIEDELKGRFNREIELVNLKYMNPLIKRKALKDIIYV